jgi:hypothetical protein
MLCDVSIYILRIYFSLSLSLSLILTLSSYICATLKNKGKETINMQSRTSVTDGGREINMTISVK